MLTLKYMITFLNLYEMDIEVQNGDVVYKMFHEERLTKNNVKLVNYCSRNNYRFLYEIRMSQNFDKFDKCAKYF
ncbi:hypothetical protein BpHYR1_045227 [Brachionus plicatilis]|uniref:Uncharacterized protein n=1 Tax=Brachionus plicatilis TaxID=10195 RepID=A0A3M7R430_BRAPC|nr:hypothetical protein BpHYR1_045227 [Brachionus plicatilis]